MPKTDAKTGRFVKGNGGGPGRGNKAPTPALGSDIAEDMRLAYTTSASPHDSPGVKAARKLAAEDYSKFVAMYLKVTGQDQAAAAATEVKELEAGPNEARIEELIKKLLDEWETGDGKRT